MAGKIKVLNIGAFKESDTWFLNDMKSFKHFFSLFDAEVNSKVFTYRNLAPGDDPGKADLIIKKLGQDFLEYIKEYSDNISSDTEFVCILIHAHGKTASNGHWQLALDEENFIPSIKIFSAFKPITDNFKTLVVLNSCNAEQEVQNKEFPINYYLPEPLVKFDLPSSFQFDFSNELNYFGEIEINNISTVKPKLEQVNANSIETYTKESISGMNIELLKLRFENNITVYEKEITKHMYFVSLSRDIVERANARISFGGILINSLCIIDDDITIPDLWKFIQSFLVNLHPKYEPILSIHSNEISAAVKELLNLRINFGFNYATSKNQIINDGFFSSISL